jgi:hypothetical protein
MSQSRSTLAILAAPIFFLAAGILNAQTSFGRISGTVTDSSGAFVSAAKVIVRNVDTQNVRTVSADDAGFYVATNLPIGRYTVEVNHPGFRPAQQSGLEIAADARITADFRLDVGEITETVEVSAGPAEQLNTVSGELARVIDSKDVQNLALNGRNYIELLTLVPGAITTNPDNFAISTSLASNTQVINGNRPDSNNLTVDGAYNQVSGSNGSLVNNVSADFIQEVKIQTSNFSAEYGRKSGAAFNIVTKNGTNQFHGAAFEYLRNDLFDARNFFSPSKTELRFNDFGGDAGGPIKRNKLFFFAGTEWKRLRQQESPTRVSVPSTAQLSGNFGTKTIDQPGTKTPFPGNVLPASMITADGNAIANVYRWVQSTSASFVDQAVSNNTILEPNNPLNFRETMVRLDYRLNDKHSLYGRWIGDANQVIDPFGTFSSSSLPVVPSNRLRPGESFVVTETWVIAPTVVNELRGSVSWVSQNIPPYGNTWERSYFGFQFPQLYTGGNYDNGIPTVSMSSISGFKGPSFSLHSPGTDMQLTDTLSVVHGAHAIKAGFMFLRVRMDQNARASHTGDVNFATSGNTNTTGNAIADSLLGNFYTYSEANGDPLGFFRFSEPEAFVQDSWKATKHLSLELGLRYQYMQPIYTTANNIANFVPSLYNPAQAVAMTITGTIVPNSGNPYDGLIAAGNGVPSDQIGRVPGAGTAAFSAVPTGAPRGLYNPASLFAPRLGVAYSLGSKTVIRGGYGVFFDRAEGNLIFSQLSLPPFLSSSEFQIGNLSKPGGGQSVTTAPLGTITAIDPNLKWSYNEQFSLSVQRELTRSLFLETSYVGNLGRHLIREANIDQPPFAALAANAALPTAQQTSTIYLNPYRGYTTIDQFRSDATSNYHALQAFLSKRTGNVVFKAGYTFSKALADASAYNDAGSPENYANVHFNYGPATFDRRHAFIGNFVWSLPGLKSRPAWLRTAAGRWQLSGIVRMQSGPYLTPTGSTSTGTRRARYLGGPVLVDSSLRNYDNWINTAAFAAAPNGVLGNAGVGIIEAPGLQTYNLSLAKHFPIRERYDLRFQADFFNAFNNVNFNTLGVVTTTAGFGTLSAAYPARNIQFGFRLGF